MIRPIFSVLRQPWFWIVLAILLRLGFGLTKLDEPVNDQDRYLIFAQSLWNGEGLVYNGHPTAYRPPLYPVLLAPLVGILGTGQKFNLALILVQSIIGGLTTGFAIVVAGRLPVGSIFRRSADTAKIPGSALFAGFITACDPVLLSQSAVPMTETLAALLVIWALACVMNEKYAQSGLVFGLAALCRPSLLACAVPVIAARCCPDRHSAGYRTQLKQLIRLGLVLFLTILPWGIRNWLVLGEPVFTTTHGGYTFALANNPVYYEQVLHGPPGSVWTGQQQQAWMDAIGGSVHARTEPEFDRKLKRKTWQFIAGHPSDFLRACVQRQLHFWAIVPSAQVYGVAVRTISGLWTAPFWGLVAISLCKKTTWRWPMLALLGVVAGLASVHLIYWTDIRMRAPIVPVLAVLASESVSWVLSWRKCPK